jgi:hypothetical protein
MLREEGLVNPSVKGSLVVGAVVAVRRHRDGGRISPEQLDARLGPGALALIDKKIDIGCWYPVADFCELVELEWEVASGRDPDHARKAGAISADHLFDRGIYQQLDYAERAVRVRNRSGLIRQARLIATITDALYNFLEVGVRVDEEQADSLLIVYSNARPFAEVLRFTTEGFMNQINHRQGSARQWTSERSRPDVVTYRMPLPSRLIAERS